PSVPRDLEAIVLTCLAKEPGRRYESAAALAADLDRWLAGQPVAARQLRRAERLAQGVRHNPGQFILAFAMCFGVMAMSVTAIGSPGQSWLHLVVTGLSATAFIAWMARMGRGQMEDLEKRLRLNRPRATTGETAEASAPPVVRPAGAFRVGDVVGA